MGLSSFIGAIFIWIVITISVIAPVFHQRTERSSLWGGCAFLTAAMLGLLAIYVSFEQPLRCQDSSCWPEKAKAEILIQFILFTWGALGATLLGKVVENKNA